MPTTPLPLKDIHLPEAISWWPPAIGWWLLLVLIPLTVFILVWAYRYLTRKTAVKTAKKLLLTLKQDDSKDNAKKLQTCRYCLGASPLACRQRRMWRV
jgi:cbb3-type cytochrome oxidase subunit 3